ISVNIGRKHKQHRQQLHQSKPWRDGEKGRREGKGKGRSRFHKMGQEESSMIDDSQPTQTLDSRTLESVAKFIRDGHARKIVVMNGAGISTSAGIPDFRSPETGLYANLARLNLPYPEAVFDISFFRNNPLPFYALAHELYPGKYRPTITHSFVSLLHKKGLLLKAFTQNIDCLEREAGLPGDMIVEAHGSFAEQSCIECKTPYPKDLMHKAVVEKTVPHCISDNCDGLVKPQIVFFGEQLPASFFLNAGLPEVADLCIVMGTSLSVHPFAGLPQRCSDGTPRVLINQEQVGAMGSRSDDVLILGSCDSGVRKLADACGWLEELEEMWAKTAPEKAEEEALERAKEQPVKSRDEELEEEVEKMTKEVEQNLRLGEAQHEWLAKHIDRKIARKGMDEADQLPEEAAKEATEQTTMTAQSVSSDNNEPVTVGGLSHVFPHLAKKSSL
ncbi:NAD-dependent deacetylase sirtuin-2, partial [Polyplosphaeria fusca]